MHPNSKLELCSLCFQQKWKKYIYEDKDVNNISNQELKQRVFTDHETWNIILFYIKLRLKKEKIKVN